MAIDMRRLALAAVEAALDTQQQKDAPPKQKKHRLGAGKALLLGAGLMTAGRVAMRARDSGLLESLQERLAALDEDQLPDAEDLEGEEEPEDLEDEPEDLEEEEPEDYEDGESEDLEEEESEDLEEEEPEDLEDEEDYEEEPEDYEDGEPEDLEEDDEEEEPRPSRVRSGAATKRGRRGSRDGHGDDDTA